MLPATTLLHGNVACGPDKNTLQTYDELMQYVYY